MNERSAPDISPIQRVGMRDATVGQAFAAAAWLAFSNGMMLLYLTKRGFDAASVVLLLALPQLVQCVTILQAAHRADRRGRSRVGVVGTIFGTIGFSIIAVSALDFFSDAHARIIVVAGILIFSFGQSLFSAAWFALLSPIVPASERGRFFGRMRLAWQFCGFVFGAASAWLLRQDTSLLIFFILLALMAIGQATRIGMTARLPELEPPNPEGRGLVESVLAVARAPNYSSFCCYAFLITLVTANTPSLFALIEKHALGFSDGGVVWMGNCLMLGSVLGFIVGGRMVDRLGTKFVFLFCHCSYALVLALFVFRGIAPIPAILWVGLLNTGFGLVSAASSVAISSEMLALVPPFDKAVSTTLCTALLVAGGGLSGALISGAMRLGMFSSDWTLAGTACGPEDAALLVCAVLVLILVVALGLVPSVMRAAEWAPKEG